VTAGSLTAFRREVTARAVELLVGSGSSAEDLVDVVPDVST
jgi:hypothetical protein